MSRAQRTRPTKPAGPIDWHDLFGLLLTDFFTGSPFRVETEPDLSKRKQLLDVVILRRRRGRFAGRLPDGLQDLVRYNLITFKSFHEPLDDWALKELTGHYVNYRKQLSEQDEPLLPESDFRLYAVCSRYPHNLAGAVPWEQVGEGVYQCRRGTDVIRVIVAGQIPRKAHNALLHLLSADPDQAGYGAEHYERKSEDTSTLLEELFARYRKDKIPMPYTIEDFRRDYAKRHFKDLSAEERQEVLQDLPAEERLEGLSDEEIERILQERKARRAAGRRKPRKGE
jgi:hypothetical protein